ncbi:MAG: alpha/beta hydrolase [Colwellia sp.]
MFTMNLKKTFYLSVVFMSFLTTNSANANQELALYFGKIPGAIVTQNNEKIRDKKDPNTFIQQVSLPTLTVFLPEKKLATGKAVIICPGGGYGGVSIVNEGYQVAQELNKLGIAAFILKYRDPDNATMVDRNIGPLQDLQQAIVRVRSEANKWHINPDDVGVMGFSAGGHLAASATTHYNQPAANFLEGYNLRPDFSILIYPVISMIDSLTHRGSQENLIGNDAVLTTKQYYSNELQVSKDTPPVFLVHAADDGAVRVENSLRFYDALLANKVPAGMLIYPEGGHGFGLINPTTNNRWFSQVADWLKTLN